jgi:hypothetical protein
MGREIRHGGWYPDLQLRLFDRRRGRWNGRIIHESVAMEPDASIGRLKADILHASVGSASEHKRMIRERYAPLGARQMLAEGRKTSSVRGALAASFAFIRTYILRAGFLDGLAGLNVARYAAYNTWLKHRMLRKLSADAD